MTFQKYLIALLLASDQAVSATQVSYTGHFTSDSETRYFDFSLTSDSTTFTINTLPLNGSFNLAGDLIAVGGFNPYLSLWNKNTGVWVLLQALPVRKQSLNSA